ncbi:MAG: hypothetical protein C4K47_10935 [Candidatus Thorarchaeota archaeon]|nr:MAG: hypothetical protein C4K47_10935 [Candidatus Thorarchaeota archaeon]
MVEVFIRYVTSTGLEKYEIFKATESHINLDLRDMTSVDLLPLIWCIDLEYLSLGYNSLSGVDLTPLAKCGRLKELRLNHNRLQEIDLVPIAECHDIREITLRENQIKRLDVTPLFGCPWLRELELDKGVTLTADLMLRSIGNWPDILVERYRDILWKARDRV